MQSYAGVGSRESPVEILKLMGLIAERNYQLGLTLRSGGAKGADLAFEIPAKDKAEIYLPWSRFEFRNGRLASYIQNEPSQLAMDLAPQFHPAWDSMKPFAQKLHARNVHQVLGRNCDDPVIAVICWTPDGAETSTIRETGGTGTAIRIAIQYRIPVFNLKNPDALNRLGAFMKGMVRGCSS